jgi:serine/threonine-protein kinase
VTAPFDLLGQALAERYRVERELGAGGMATVYLAHDLKHDRKVAIKVLHPELAAVIGAERFLAEIRTTAGLQHPHILPLFDSGVVGADPAVTPHTSRLLFYVMPFIDGESLRQRLVRERQLPVPDAVRIAGEVASALDYAHRKGIVHRDIKPENILLHDGAALVADFGIALAVTAAGGGRLTQTGLSLGTPAYMSPEQAMGEREIGPRSDVYALGAVTYEMLSGEPPFTGPTSQAIVARTLTEQPRPLRVERKSIPEHVEATVLGALEKLPADRPASAREFADGRQESGRVPGRQGGAATTVITRRTALASSPRRWLVPLLSVATAASVLACLVLLTRPAPALPASTPVEFRPVEMGNLDYFSVSQDGRYLVGTAPDSSGKWHAMLRRLDDTEITVVPGTEGVTRAWLTPDNRALVVRADAALRLLPLAGGSARELARVDGYVTVEWAPGDSLLTVVHDKLLMIPLDGGTTRTVASLDTATGTSFYIPRYLPGQRQVLVGHRHSPDSVTLYQMDPATGASVAVHPNVQEVRPYPPDRLLWLDGEGRVRYGTYDQRARRFGERQLVLAEGVDDFFANGDVVALRPGQPQRVLWTLAADALQPARIVIPDTTTNAPRFSPDGTRLAFVLTPTVASRTSNNLSLSDDAQLWVLDRRTGLRRPIASRAADFAWTPDSRTIVFVRRRPAPLRAEIWTVPADGSAPPVKVAGNASPMFNAAVTPDGRGFLGGDHRSRHLSLASLANGEERVPFDEPAIEFGPEFSPDGRWLLYGIEEEDGSALMIVRAWPGLDRRAVVGPLGFCPMRWGDRGRRIYTCSPDGALSWIAFDPVAGRTVGSSQPVAAVGVQNPEFDVNPAGTDLAWIPVPPRFGTSVRVLTNWRGEAERKLAGR